MLNNFKILDTTYEEWKLCASRPGVQTFYVVTPSSATKEAVAIDSNFIYRTVLTKSADLTDFIANYQPDAIQVSVLDDAIAIADKGSSVLLVDQSGNSIGLPSGTSIPSGQGAILVEGKSPTGTAQILQTDSTGNLKVSLVAGGGPGGSPDVNISDTLGNSITVNSGGSLKNTIYDAIGNIAIGTTGLTFPFPSGVVIVGGTDGTKTQAIATDTSGRIESQIFDVNGNPVDLQGNTALASNQGGVLIAGSDGTNAQLIKTDSDGVLQVSFPPGDDNVNIHDSSGTSITLFGGNLKTTLFDPSENIAIGTQGLAFPATAGVVIVGGTDGTNTTAIATDTSGRVKTDIFDSAGNSLNSTSNALNISLRDAAGTAVTLAGNNLQTSIYDASSNIAVGTQGSSFPSPAGVVIVGGTDGTDTRAISLSPTGIVSIQGFDANGNFLSPQNNTAIAVNQGGLLISGSDGTNSHILLTNSSGAMEVTFSGPQNVNIHDSAGNTLNSTSGALDINVSSVTGTNLPISIAAQSLAAVAVSKNNTTNAVANPIFVELSNGINPFGTSSAPVFINVQDGSGNAILSTGGALNVSLPSTTTVRLTDSAGTAITLNFGGSLKQTIYDALGNIAVGTQGVAFPATAGVTIVGGTDGTNTQTLSLDSTGKLKNILFDNQDNPLALQAGTAIAGTQGGALIAGSDGTNARIIATDISGRLQTDLFDGSGNIISSTSGALDINVKSVTGTNLPVSIAAQSLGAVVALTTTAANAVTNPIFVELSNGTVAFGTSSAPVFINLKDGSGNALTSTSNKLDVGLTGANTVKLNDSAGTAITLSGANLKTSLFDATGDAAIVADAVATPASRGVVMVAGNDGANVRLFATDTSGRQKVTLFDGSGTALTSTSGKLDVGLTGANTVKLDDGSGNAITSTSSALDVNVKSVTGTNLPISIAAQSLGAVVVSATTAANAVTNPIFVELSNGTSAFGTSSAPVFVNLKDGSGNALTSTSNKLDVGLTGANTVKLNDSAGTAITLSGANLKTSLFDAAGDAAIVADAVATPASRGVVMVAGNDGANVRLFATDTSGRQKVTLFDNQGNSLAPQAGNAIAGTQGGLLIAGSDGTDTRIIKTDSSGVVQVSLASGIVDNVSITSFVATDTNQIFITASLTTSTTTANQTVVTYTVPAGLDLLIIGWDLSKAAGNAVELAPARLRVAGIDIAIRSTNGEPRYWNVSLGCPGVFIATAAQVVTLTITPSAATGTTWTGYISGYLKTHGT